MSVRVAVIGAGIVGLAVAREVALRRPGAEVLVVDKEDRVGAHQTGHNSGVVHAGIYYAPGSLKATLCARGRVLLRDYCRERGLPYDECGKLVVAVDRAELGRLDELERRSMENGVPGLRRVDAAGIREFEPQAVGLAALHSPETAITDFVAVCEAYAADVRAHGGAVLLGHEVVGLREVASGVRVEMRVRGGASGGAGESGGPGETRGARETRGAGETRVEQVDEVIVCAGLQSDRVGVDGTDARGHRRERIIPFRGEYLRVVPAKQDLVRGMVYPVPDPRYPFLGVHFTRRVDGSLDVGPNAVLGLSREAYGRIGFSPRDVRDLASWPGLWRLAGQHWRTGITEMRGSLSLRHYMAGASRYVPAITAADVRRGPVGIRAQAIDRDGSLVDDFRIETSGRVTSVRNAPSPAATSSLAIAEHVVGLLGRRGR